MKRKLLLSNNPSPSFHKKKYLGQHFLNNKKILEEICRAAELTKKDVVLEVGPGLGSLTQLLAQKAKKVIAVEKDRDLIPILREKFKDYKNVEIIEGDVLKIFNFQFSIFNQFKNLKIRNSLEIRNWKLEIPKSYKVVANLPYYITSRFLRLFLSETKFRSKLMVLMVQKEVAERICLPAGKAGAKPPHMNLLALSVQAYAEPEIIRKVSKGNFSPPPKVDSAIIKISPLKVRGARGVMNPERILRLARIAFQQRRKMLRHSLKNKLSTSDVDRFGNKRPEELSLKDWIAILEKPN